MDDAEKLSEEEKGDEVSSDSSFIMDSQPIASRDEPTVRLIGSFIDSIPMI